jgi:hypothetical protein
MKQDKFNMHLICSPESTKKPAVKSLLRLIPISMIISVNVISLQTGKHKYAMLHLFWHNFND